MYSHRPGCSTLHHSRPLHPQRQQPHRQPFARNLFPLTSSPPTLPHPRRAPWSHRRLRRPLSPPPVPPLTTPRERPSSARRSTMVRPLLHLLFSPLIPRSPRTSHHPRSPNPVLPHSLPAATALPCQGMPHPLAPVDHAQHILPAHPIRLAVHLPHHRARVGRINQENVLIRPPLLSHFLRPQRHSRGIAHPRIARTDLNFHLEPRRNLRG
jgi:hypothetical protein